MSQFYGYNILELQNFPNYPKSTFPIYITSLNIHYIYQRNYIRQCALQMHFYSYSFITQFAELAHEEQLWPTDKIYIYFFFHVLLTVHLSVFILIINQFDAKFVLQ